MIISPSLLSANWNIIKNEINSLNHPSVKWIHFDVMDGKFVPAITYTPQQLANIRQLTTNLLDVHLMVVDPIKQATKYAQAGADLITFHYEAVTNVNETIFHIKNLNCKVGISIKPNTPVTVLAKYLKLIDVVLVMSVEPGKDGQVFLLSALEKIKYLNKWKNKDNFKIELDGGINDKTSKICTKYGADVLVSGSYIFKAVDRFKQIETLIHE